MELTVLDCRGCGACCTHMGSPPGYALFSGRQPRRVMEASPDWPIYREIPAAVRRELEAYYHAALVLRTTPDRSADGRTPCLWYDEVRRECRHYAHRPTVCREFEVGSRACRRHRRRCGIETGGETHAGCRVE